VLPSRQKRGTKEPTRVKNRDRKQIAPGVNGPDSEEKGRRHHTGRLNQKKRKGLYQRSERVLLVKSKGKRQHLKGKAGKISFPFKLQPCTLQGRNEREKVKSPGRKESYNFPKKEAREKRKNQGKAKEKRFGSEFKQEVDL